MGLTLSALGSFPLAVCFHPPLTSIGAAAHDVFRLECVDLLTFKYLPLAEFLREVNSFHLSTKLAGLYTLSGESVQWDLLPSNFMESCCKMIPASDLELRELDLLCKFVVEKSSRNGCHVANLH